MIKEILSVIQAELNAPKNQFNKFGGYNYRNCEDILEALKPFLKAYKAAVTISDEIVLIGERYYIKATATLSVDGESESASAYAREPSSRKGMDEAQVTGATSSYARKYALNGLFAIDDNKDPDSMKPNRENTDKPVQSPSKPVSEAKLKEIEFLAEKAGVAIAKLEKKYNVRLLSALTQEQAQECIKGLQGMLNE